MKKIAIAAVIIAALWFTANASRFAYRAGIRHAIEDSEIWTVTCYNPDDPDDSAWQGYDQQIFITLDGETYSHGMYQG